MKYQPQHEVPYEEEKRNQSLQKFYLASFHNKYMKEYWNCKSRTCKRCAFTPLQYIICKEKSISTKY